MEREGEVEREAERAGETLNALCPLFSIGASKCMHSREHASVSCVNLFKNDKCHSSGH